MTFFKDRPTCTADTGDGISPFQKICLIDVTGPRKRFCADGLHQTLSLLQRLRQASTELLKGDISWQPEQ
jgi:hypothetical protein